MSPRRWALAALTAACVLASAAPAAADVHKVFMHFNMCGHSCEYGDTGLPVDAVANSIKSHGAQAVSLNEVCHSQVATLRSRLANDGYSMNYAFAQGHFGDNTCAQDAAGIAIMSKAAMWDVGEWSLPDNNPADSTQRKLLCATTNYARDTKICTTHLHPGEDFDDPSKQADWQVREQQARFIAQETDWFVDIWPVVMMGDFNARPKEPAMNYFYTREHGQDNFETWAHGRYKEVDRAECASPPARCGEYTWPFPPDGREDERKKIDYIFVSNPQWYDVTGDVTDNGSWSDSDHRLVHGTAMLRTG